MNSFYDYLSALEPEPEQTAGIRQTRNCRKAVCAAMRPTRCRRGFRYALLAAVAAMTVTAALSLPVLQSRAKRPDWREHYRWMPVKPEAEIQADAALLRPITVTEPQSVKQSDYTVTVTGYASDGVSGMCFLEVRVPADFDWAHPYLMFGKAAAVRTPEGQTLDPDYGSFFDCALTPTADPQVYLAEAAFAYDTGEYETQEPVLATFYAVLRDENFDFDDQTGTDSGENNPHQIHFDGAVTLRLEQNDWRTEQYSEESGTLRITPFGIYAFAYDNAAQVNWHRTHHMQIMMPDGNPPESCDFRKRTKAIQPQSEDMPDAETVRYSAVKTAVFMTPADPKTVTVTFSE